MVIARLNTKNSYTMLNGKVSLNFTVLSSTAKMIANMPYIILTSKDVSEISANDVTINVGNTKKMHQEEDQDTGEMIEIASITGVYKAGSIIPTDNLFIYNNKFWYSVGKTKTKGYRAYLWLKDKVEDASSRISLSFDDSEVTGIKTVDKKVSDKYYNLRGQQVKTPARSAEGRLFPQGLKKGIYVKDGNKVIIK